MKKTALLSLALLLGSILELLSQDQPSPPLVGLTLQQALDHAYKNHPSLAEVAAELDAAKARAEGAGKLPNPELVARMESAPINSKTASQAEYVAGVSQAIPFGSRLSSARKVEQAAAATKQRELAAQAVAIRRSVHAAFATALFTSQALQVQTNFSSTLLELLRVTKVRVGEGDLAPLDLARIGAEEAQQRLEVKEAQRLHSQAMHALASALGDFRLPIRSLAGELEEALELPAMRQWTAGSADHPAISAAESARLTEQARLRLARAERVPDVNLDLFYRRLQATREDAFDVGLSVAIPVFDRKRARIREAESNIAAADARAERIRNEIGRDLRSSELALQTGLETATLLKEEVLPKIQQALDGAEARFTAGDINLSELLLVRREALLAQLQYLATLRDIMEAWAALNLHSGNGAE